ncbi:MAG TPA: MaoC family dehydratase [Acetobacteraceae bacterium]|nr:MaoC family dehydratase [Acetobacteraceae bacterium]
MREVAYADLPALAGQEIGVSDWVEISQERIDRFADVTEDRQWIHVDVERARREVGGTVAHGFLTLSMIPVLSQGTWRIEGVSRSLNYGCNKLRFTDVVPAGARIRMRNELLSAEPKTGGLLLTSRYTIEVEGKERPALIAEWLALVFP